MSRQADEMAPGVIQEAVPNPDVRIQCMRVIYEDHPSGSAYVQQAVDWAGEDHIQIRPSSVVDNRPFGVLQVKTLEGWVDLPSGHLLMKGTNGEFYPCDPDVFENRWRWEPGPGDVFVTSDPCHTVEWPVWRVMMYDDGPVEHIVVARDINSAIEWSTDVWPGRVFQVEQILTQAALVDLSAVR